MDTKPSSHYHPPQVKKFNRIRRCLNAVGLAKIDLSEASLLATARQETGLDCFGDESFLPSLRMLLKCLETEAQLNPFGRQVQRTRILRSLKNRLWANACFEAHPEILQRKIVAPIIIVGPGRSGTTRLQRMLTTDTRLQHLKAWEGFNPAPHLESPDFGKTIRRIEAKALLEKVRHLNPGAYAAHPMDADWAEEEILLLDHSFCSLQAFAFRDYYDWLLNDDRTTAYRYMADLIKLISWSRGDAEGKRWVMKTPQFMLDLDVLMSTFPDAQIVFTHRDPLKTVPSMMSLMWNFAVLNTDHSCRTRIKDVWLDLCEKMAQRSMEARGSIPAAQQLDVYYEEMNNNWRETMQRIYNFSGIEFTPAAESAMNQWLTHSEKENRHGAHRYLLEEFGLTTSEVDARMMFARQRHDIPYEKR